MQIIVFLNSGEKKQLSGVSPDVNTLFIGIKKQVERHGCRFPIWKMRLARVRLTLCTGTPLGTFIDTYLVGVKQRLYGFLKLPGRGFHFNR